MLLFIGSLLTESLSLVLGIGRSARIDWSCEYVTMRYIFLPIASIALIRIRPSRPCCFRSRGSRSSFTAPLHRVPKRRPTPAQTTLAALSAFV
jgi:hypothetical protein